MNVLASLLYLLQLGTSAANDTRAFAQVPDMPGLSVAIVEAIRHDAGFSATSEYPPVGSGQLLVDDSAFVRAFAFVDSVGETSIRQTLTMAGYSFGNLNALVSSGTTATGSTEYWLNGDHVVARLHSIAWDGRVVTATASFYYT